MSAEDRFMVRRDGEFAAVRDLVGGRYWWMKSRDQLRDRYGLGVVGAYGAVQWLSGAQPIPPGYDQPRARTRYDLLDLLRIAELACEGGAAAWEAATRGGPGGVREHFDPSVAAGARTVYEWAVGLRTEIGYLPLMDEDLRAAAAFRQSEQRRLAALAAADAASPYRHLVGVLAVSPTEFAKVVADGERQYTEGGYNRTPLADEYEGALAAGRWILGAGPHPVTGQPVAVTGESLRVALDEVLDALYTTRTVAREPGSGMKAMFQYALGLRPDPPVAWVGALPGRFGQDRAA